jgi:hypothetical protein
VSRPRALEYHPCHRVADHSEQRQKRRRTGGKEKGDRRTRACMRRGGSGRSLSGPTWRVRRVVHRCSRSGTRL